MTSSFDNWNPLTRWLGDGTDRFPSLIPSVLNLHKNRNQGSARRDVFRRRDFELDGTIFSIDSVIVIEMSTSWIYPNVSNLSILAVYQYLLCRAMANDDSECPSILGENLSRNTGHRHIRHSLVDE